MTSEIEAKGLKAYEQARAFERLRAWRLPVSYGIFVAIPVLFGVVMMRSGHVGMAGLQFVAAFLFVLVGWFHWRRLKGRYVGNLELLAELEKAYGDQLPWVQVKKHFAELEKLQREIAEEKLGRPAE